MIKAGACCEESCPTLCLCIEAHLCNAAAISATRMLVMDRYDVSTDPCDNRLIRCNNCLQALRCICDTIAIFYKDAQDLATIIDIIAEITYHTVSGCMTAQVAHEINYQMAHAPTAQRDAGGFEDTHNGVYNHNSDAPVAVAVPYDAPKEPNAPTGANAMMTDNKKW